MRKPAVIIGIGQIGTVFAKGFLRLGYPVFPVLRGSSLSTCANEVTDPVTTLIAVREEDLHIVLEQLPLAWANSVVLVQNDLLPRDWEKHKIGSPTVVSVWFEKREGVAPTPYFPSPIFGPQDTLIRDVFRAVDLPQSIMSNYEAMVTELVRKNLYIISKNIVGLVAEGTVGEVWEQDQDVFFRVIEDVFNIQAALVEIVLDKERLLKQVADDIEALPDKGTAGGSAKARLTRMLQAADSVGINASALAEIQNAIDG
jgi:ketopantoate reductase